MRKDTCVHFTGIQFVRDEARLCKAGVDYETWPAGLPCVLSNAGCGPCAKFQPPTDQQISDYNRDSEESLNRVLALMEKGMPAVNKWRKAQGWSKRNKVSATGTVACGACGNGTIHLSMAAYNGHVWGKCTTKGCLEWIE